MHELSRMAYLEAMGVDSYVSRQQLPGAAMTRRLAILRSPEPLVSASSVPAKAESVVAETVRSVPTIDIPEKTARKKAPEVAPAETRAPEDLIKLNLFAMKAGNYLWLESLGESPLASEQVMLIRSMAHALAIARGEGARFDRGERPEISHFNWPMHNNVQLDNSAEAAKSGLAAFLSRRLESHNCQHLVILGESAGQWVSAEAIGKPAIVTASTGEMCADPQIKTRVWQDLKPLYSGT
jgi:hypothetical protein